MQRCQQRAIRENEIKSLQSSVPGRGRGEEEKGRVAKRNERKLSY